MANTGTGLTYQWYSSQLPHTLTGATAASYTAATPGTYYVSVTNGGCTTTSSSVIVNLSPEPIISATGPTTVCTGNHVILSTSSSAVLTYKWYNGGTAIAGATAYSYTASSTGNYAVAVTNSYNCTTTSVATAVTVNPIPTASITATGPTTFCQSSSVVLNANTGTGLTYQWYNGGTAIAGATMASYTANTTGTYTVSVTNSFNCTTTSTVTNVTVNSYPSATISYTAPTFCYGSNVVITANSGTGLTYQWLSDGTPVTGATASTYTATITSTYAVVVTSNGCSTTSASATVTGINNPVAAITAAGPTIFCQGNSVVLNANSGTSLAYQWYNQGTAIAGAVTSSYTANATGNYSVAVSFDGCSTTSAGTQVTIPVATTTPSGSSASFCSGNSLVLNANTGTGITNYQWYTNTEPIDGATASTYTITNGNVGTYFVLEDNNGCYVTSTPITVSANALPSPSVNIPNPTTFCQGGSAIFEANTGTGLTYQWYNNGVAIPGATAANYTATISGVFSLIETNSFGCSASIGGTAAYTTFLDVPNATISQGLVNNCTGAFFVNPATPGATYQWSDYEYVSSTNSYAYLPISGATNSSYNPPQIGTYSVTVTSKNGCFTVCPNPITLSQQPVPSAFITIGDYSSCGGSYIVNPTTSGATYQWYLNSSPLNGATGYGVNPAWAGTYSVSVTLNGCTVISADTWTTPGNDGECGPPRIGINLDSLNKANSKLAFNVFPNPAKDKVNLSYSGGNNIFITIYNTLGETVYNMNFKNESGNYELEIPLHYASGLYVLSLEDDNNNMTDKIIIE